MKTTFKRVLIFVLLFSLCLNTLSTTAASKSKTKNLTSTINVKKAKAGKITRKDAGTLTTASLDLLNTEIKQKGDDSNVLISPSSIMFAFGMAENGARGKTKSQIEKKIFGGIKTDKTNGILRKYKSRMVKDKYVDFNTANSIWMSDRKDVKVKKSYLKNVKANYDAEIYKAPFDLSTVNDMNKWVKKNTKKMIPKIVDRIDSESVMYLINAMSFEAEWQEPFENYQIRKKARFYNIDGSKSKAVMMDCDATGYFELYGAKGFKKPYQGGNYSFVGIEMPDGMKPSEYIEKICKNGNTFNKKLRKMKFDKIVKVSMPQFSVDYSSELTETLKSMGVTYAFNPDKANLYNMFKKDGDFNYYFSKVLHKTHIEVDKDGTRAAAATAIVLDKNTSIVDKKEVLHINLDHPFVYAIVDNKTNVPIFIGVLNNYHK